jgi:hypothetical protein
MLNTETFSEILEGLLQDKPSESALSHPPPYYESVQDPFGFTSLLVNTPRYEGSRKPQAGRAYQLKVKTRQPRAAHLFNDEQTLAFAVIKRWAPHLTDNFSRSELKRAYRLAVLKAHPDQGGSSESFHEVRKSYQILEALVKTEA